MDLQRLNKVCFTKCIVCIVLGVVLSLALILGRFQRRIRVEIVAHDRRAVPCLCSDAERK